jgi:hypothetical protein
LSIRAFDIQSGWRDAYERQKEYIRRDLFMGKLKPEKNQSKTARPKQVPGFHSN